MKNSANLFLLLFILLFTCNKNTKKQGETVIHVDVNKVSDFNLDDIAFFEKMIPLETTESNSIKRIERIFLMDTCLLIWDKNLHNIHVYNLNGNFLHFIGKRGQGPKGYYIEITDVFVNYPEKTVSILDNSAKKILSFHIDGEFISSSQLSCFGYSFFDSKEGYWILNHAQNPMKYNVLLVDKKSNEIIRGFLKSEKFLPLIATNNFFRDNNNQVYFHYPNEDFIYKIEGEILKPSIYIDFGKEKNPYIDINSAGYHDYIQRNEFAGQINRVFIYDDKLFFSFSKYYGKERKIDNYQAFVSLTDRKAVVYDYKTVRFSSKTTIQPELPALGLSNGRLFYQINPNILNDQLIDRLKESPGLDRKYVHWINADSNPVLVVYQLKE
jgi:hypothetical protein